MPGQNLKSEKEIARMRKAGLLTWQAHQVAAELIKPGVRTGEINVAVERFLRQQRATALFKGVLSQSGQVPFPAATCISVNEELVHGIPGDRQLREGDIISIDIGVRYNSWCGDAAVTYTVGPVEPRIQQLVEVAEGALKLAITSIPRHTMWSQVAREMELYVRGAGFAVVEGLVGHSIGRELWEAPQVPNYYTLQYEALGDFPLKPGVVIAVEPMVTMRSHRVRTLEDHWTIVAQDGKPAAHFEHTLAITERGVEVLTAGPDGQGWAIPSRE